MVTGKRSARKRTDPADASRPANSGSSSSSSGTRASATQPQQSSIAHSGTLGEQAALASASAPLQGGQLRSATQPRPPEPDMLRHGILTGDIHVVHEFLKAGGSPNTVFERGVTALMLAASHHRVLPAFQLLLRQADVAAVDADGWSAADYAASSGDCALVDLLWALHPWGDDAGGEEALSFAPSAQEGSEEEQQRPPEAGGAPVSSARHRDAVSPAVKRLEPAAGIMASRFRPGFTPLMLAAMHGAAPALQQLLRRAAAAASLAGDEAGAPGAVNTHPDVNAVDATGRTALHYAASCSRHAAGAAAARALLAAGAQPQQGADGCGALLRAAECNNTAVARVLLDAGADPQSVLAYAALGASPPFVALLLEAGAHPQAFGCKTGNSALEFALLRGAAEVALQLLAAGADVTLPNAQGQRDPVRASSVSVLAMTGEEALNPESVGELVKALVARGVSPDTRYRDGTTMLMAACGACTTDGMISAYKKASSQNAGEDLDMCPFVANLPAVRTLLAAGADVNLEAGAGWTALHIACMAANGHEAVAVLLAAGARTNAPASTCSSTVLGTALLNGTLATVELLLGCGGVDPNQPVQLKDCSTSHPLLLACEQRPEAVPLLLAAGAHPSLGHGCLSGLGVGDWYKAASPLMAAATVGSEEAVVALLEAGSDPLVVRNCAVAKLQECLAQASMSDKRDAEMEARACEAVIQKNVSSERIRTLLFDAIERRQAQVIAQERNEQQQQQQQQQQQRQQQQQQQQRKQQKQQQQKQKQDEQQQWAKAEEIAAQLLADEEAEKARAAAKSSWGSKHSKGPRGAKGVQQAAGPGREIGAVQVEAEEGDRGAMGRVSAASAAAASEAGPSGSAVAARDTSAAANVGAASWLAGGRAGGAATSAAVLNVRGQPMPGPKGGASAAEVVEGSSTPTAPSPAPPPRASAASQVVSPAAHTAPVPGDRLSGAPGAAGGRLPTSAALDFCTPFSGTAHNAPPRLSFSRTTATPSSQPMHDDGLCVVCMERRPSTVLVPCSHVVMCQACCDAVREARDECPLCREPIDAVLVVL